MLSLAVPVVLVAWACLQRCCRLEFIAEKEVLRFCLPPAEVPVFWPEPEPAAWVLERSAALEPPSCLRCWNFSLIEESLDWYWFILSEDVSAPPAAC